MSEFQLFRKKPVIIRAARWLTNGDHPEDYAEDASPYYRREKEGAVVRFYRHHVPGERLCQHCRVQMHSHGWIDTKEGGHIVCPGDWIITGVAGERYPCKPDIFDATYELVPESAA